MKKSLLFIITAIFIAGCNSPESQETKDKAKVQQQQSQYAIAQPIPAFNWSLERDLLKKLYELRNQKVSTHSVWRSDYGMVEGECTSMGYGLPYDTSLTNPTQTEWRSSTNGRAVAVIGQAEPNGVFASTNTAATWVMCLGTTGNIEPHYIESKVTVYPYPVSVDFTNNRVVKAGKTTATIKSNGK